MNLKFTFAYGHIVKLSILLIVFSSILLCSNSCRQKHLEWLVNAQRTLERVDRELYRAYLSNEDVIKDGLPEFCEQIRMNENVQFDIQFTIKTFEDYQLLFDTRRRRINSDTSPDRFNPMIAYIDDDRGYCSVLFLDGVVVNCSRSALPELIENATTLLAEAKSENTVQEGPMNNADLRRTHE